VQALYVAVVLHWFGVQGHDETYCRIRVKEHLHVAVAACILGTKSRTVKKELLLAAFLEITVFCFSVGYGVFFFNCSWMYEMCISCQGPYQLSCDIEVCYSVYVTAVAVIITL
jgi:hypothetical protein